jgi:hypothetical protein
MDTTCHDLLRQLDDIHAKEHALLLEAWKNGPFAEWQKKAADAAKARTVPPARPTPPGAPPSPSYVLRNVASTYGLTVDDLVRHARETEVRTVYSSPESLDRARADLGPALCNNLKTLDWPPLPPKPAAPPPPPVSPEPEQVDPEPTVDASEEAPS